MTRLAVLLLLISVPLYSRENSSLLYSQGSKLAKNGDVDQAIEIFKKVILLSPYFAMGHYGLGKAYLTKTGKHEEAVRELRAACTLDPSFSRAHFYLGMAYMYAGDQISAIHEFNEAYQLDHTCIEALYNMGAVYETIGNSFKSQKYFILWYRKKNEPHDTIFNL
jgi:tetratricopeptide (TPR) repeat protein